MKSRIALFLGLFLVAYLFFLVWYMPAPYVLQRAQALVPAGTPVEIVDVQGFWHRGQATALTIEGRRLTDLSWRFRPLALFTGRLAVDCNFLAQGERFKVRLGRSLTGYFISNVTGRYPVAAINALLVPGEVLPVTGEIELAVEAIRVRENQLAGGTGEIVWHQAQTTLMPEIKLDGLRLTFEDAGGALGLKGNVVDLGGPVLVDLQLTLSPVGRYQCTGKIGTRGQANRQVLEGLKLLGRLDRNGTIKVNQSGTL